MWKINLSYGITILVVYYLVFRFYLYWYALLDIIFDEPYYGKYDEMAYLSYSDVQDFDMNSDSVGVFFFLIHKVLIIDK